MALNLIDKGNLPKGWVSITIGKFLRNKSKSFNPKKEPGKTLELYSVPSHEFKIPETVRSSDIGSNKQYVETGDVLISKINPRINRVWIVGNNTNFDKIASTEWIVFSKNNMVESDFLNYLLQSFQIRDYLSHNASGVGGSLMRVKPSLFNTISIGLPPLNEQRRIVAKIEALFSELDAGVASLQTAAAQLKTYRQALLKHAFEGKLTAEWRAENGEGLETAECLLERIKAERKARHKAELDAWKAEVETWKAAGKPGRKPRKPRPPKELPPLTEKDTGELPELPEGWVSSRINALGEVKLGRQRSPKNRSKDFPTKYIRAANITENGIDLTDVMDMDFKPADFQTYKLKYGDILLSEASGSPDQVGKPAIWREQIPNCCFQNTVIRLRLPDSLHVEYFLLLFKHFYANGVFSKAASGVGINHLSASRFASLFAPVPPINEQRKIAEEIDSKISIIDQLEKDITTALQQSKALRQSILKKAFAGQLVPQDPNDEPAAALLARIRAEKHR